MLGGTEGQGPVPGYKVGIHTAPSAMYNNHIGAKTGTIEFTGTVPAKPTTEMLWSVTGVPVGGWHPGYVKEVLTTF